MAPPAPGQSRPLRQGGHPRAQLLGEQRSEPELPLPYRLVGDLEPALEQHLGDVAEAELIAKAPQHGEEHEVGWVLEVVERRPGALVEGAPAGATCERTVPE